MVMMGQSSSQPHALVVVSQRVRRWGLAKCRRIRLLSLPDASSGEAADLLETGRLRQETVHSVGALQRRRRLARRCWC